MAKTHTKKAKVDTPVVEVEAVEAPIEEVKAEEVVVEAKKEVPKKKEAPKQSVMFDSKTVSQSTKRVTFEWSKGKKSGTKETMSENVAEIMEHKGLGKKVK